MELVRAAARNHLNLSRAAPILSVGGLGHNAELLDAVDGHRVRHIGVECAVEEINPAC